jgi:hypothetical protein
MLLTSFKMFYHEVSSASRVSIDLFVRISLHLKAGYNFHSFQIQSFTVNVQLRPVQWYHFYDTLKFATYRAGRKKNWLKEGLYVLAD